MQNVDCSKYINVEKYKLHSFARIIFGEVTILEEEKHKFVNNFLINYLEDDEFRKSVQELHMFFVYGKLWHKLGNDGEDVDISEDVPGHEIFCVLVTDNPVKYYV